MNLKRRNTQTVKFHDKRTWLIFHFENMFPNDGFIDSRVLNWKWLSAIRSRAQHFTAVKRKSLEINKVIYSRNHSGNASKWCGMYFVRVIDLIFFRFAFNSISRNNWEQLNGNVNCLRLGGMIIVILAFRHSETRKTSSHKRCHS